MSRSYFTSEPGQWRMFCDACSHHDDATFDAAPALLPFHQAGWFIGQRVDACPKCGWCGGTNTIGRGQGRLGSSLFVASLIRARQDGTLTTIAATGQVSQAC